jgi:hypothetical protein
MTKDEALKLALEALEYMDGHYLSLPQQGMQALTAIKEALAQPAQEPDELTIAYMSGLYDGKKKRPWVGLTDEDEIPWDGVDAKSFAKAIEAKLKEKNT